MFTTDENGDSPRRTSPRCRDHPSEMRCSWNRKSGLGAKKPQMHVNPSKICTTAHERSRRDHQRRRTARDNVSRLPKPGIRRRSIADGYNYAVGRGRPDAGSHLRSWCEATCATLTANHTRMFKHDPDPHRHPMHFLKMDARPAGSRTRRGECARATGILFVETTSD